MSESPVFEWISQQLQEATFLDRLSARGTVRIALRKGGLHPETLSPEELELVLIKVIPRELQLRGIDDGEGLCRQLVSDLRTADLAEAPPAHKTPEGIFRRVFGEERQGEDS